MTMSRRDSFVHLHNHSQFSLLDGASKLEEMAETRFEADPVQLKQVLINLIQNAADAIGRRGTITLRARQDQVRIAGRPTPSVVLEVQDPQRSVPAHPVLRAC